MRKETIEKYKGQIIKIVTKREYIYKGKITDVTDKDCTIDDQKLGQLSIDLDEIAQIYFLGIERPKLRGDGSGGFQLD